MKTNIFSPVYSQEDLAFNLIFSGSTLFLAGLVQGLTVGLSRYPQIAVHVHSQAVIVGMSLIVMGGLVTQTQLVGYLTPREVWTVWASSVPTWPMWIMQNAQSIWGTKKMNNLVAARAGAPGADDWKENLVSLAHVAAAMDIFAWGVIVKALIYPRTPIV